MILRLFQPRDKRKSLQAVWNNHLLVSTWYKGGVPMANSRSHLPCVFCVSVATSPVLFKNKLMTFVNWRRKPKLRFRSAFMYFWFYISILTSLQFWEFIPNNCAIFNTFYRSFEIVFTAFSLCPNICQIPLKFCWIRFLKLRMASLVSFELIRMKDLRVIILRQNSSQTAVYLYT